jgi:hypothetical protein
MLQMMVSLHYNQHVNLEKHLPQILPAIFTCLIAGNLQTFPEHLTILFQLKNFAAKLIGQLLSKYALIYSDFTAKVCKTYLDALLQAISDLLTHTNQNNNHSPNKMEYYNIIYGSLVGLSYVDMETIHNLLLPQLSLLQSILCIYSDPYSTITTTTTTTNNNNNNSQQQEQQQVMMMDIVHLDDFPDQSDHSHQSHHPPSSSSSLSWNELQQEDYNRKIYEENRFILCQILGRYMIYKLTQPIIMKPPLLVSLLSQPTTTSRSITSRNNNNNNNITTSTKRRKLEGNHNNNHHHSQQQKQSNNNNMELCDFEEQLVPYYASQMSKVS